MEPPATPHDSMVPLRIASPGQVVQLDGRFCVVLGHGPTGLVTVYRDGHHVVISDTAEARPVTPSSETDLRAEAMRALYQSYRHAVDELRAERSSSMSTRHRIREYALRQYRRQIPICRAGLIEFLDEFDMAPLRQRVRYTITGSFLIDAHDDDGPSGLDEIVADLSGVDGLVDDSDTHEVSIDEVTDTDD